MSMNGGPGGGGGGGGMGNNRDLWLLLLLPPLPCGPISTSALTSLGGAAVDCFEALLHLSSASLSMIVIEPL